MQKKLDVKKTIKCIIIGLMCLSLIFCIVKILVPCRTYEFTGESVFTEGQAEAGRVVYAGISLPVGIYVCELSYESESDAKAYVNVRDTSVYSGGLLSIGEPVYSGLSGTSFDFYLFESTESLSVAVNYEGEGALSIGSLKIVETNGIWLRTTVILMFAFLIILGLQLFKKYDAAHEDSGTRRLVLFGILVISFVASIPYFYDGLITGADLGYHLQRIEGIKDALVTGQFPVRIEPRWVFNHGYADAIFYCNFFLYLPAVLRLCGFTVTESYVAYAVSMNLACTVVSYWSYSRLFKDKKLGLVLSALYTLSIFHLYKFTITGAIGEGSAFVFLPLIVYGLYLIFEEDVSIKSYKYSFFVLGFGLAGVFQTHVLTSEISAFIMFLVCLIFLPRLFKEKRFLKLIEGGLLAVGLSLWYLVPFADYYLTQDIKIHHASARRIQEMGTLLPQLFHHFWTNGSRSNHEGGMQYSHPLGVGSLLFVTAVIFAGLLFAGVFKKDKSREKHFSVRALILSAITLFMSTCYFPWDFLQDTSSTAASLVSSLQFPNRMLGYGTAFLVVVIGFVLSHFEKEKVSFYRIGLACVLIFLSTSYMYLTDSVTSDADYKHIYNEEGMGFGYISGAEYLIYGTDAEKLTFAKPEASEQISITDYEKKGLKISLSAVNDSKEEGEILLPVLMYKGYEVTSGEGVTLLDGENHLISLKIPAGYEGGVTVNYVEPVYWRIAEILTLATYACCIWYFVRFLKQSKALKGGLAS